MSKLVIMVGLPGSGKSTYATKYTTQDRTTLVSTDEIRGELYGNPETQGNAQDVFNEAYRRIEIALRAGDTVVFDATNLKARNRRYIINKFRPLADSIIAEYLNTPIEECIHRDELRSRTVGYEVIQRMARGMTEPRLDEGFDLVHIVGKS